MANTSRLPRSAPRIAIPAGGIAGYRILEPIGSGRTAVVHRAVHLQLQREVALKFLSPELAERPGFRERFLAEARAAAAVRHHNLVQCYDVGDQDGILYQALELVAGDSLEQRLIAAGGMMPAAQALPIVQDCVRGLEAVHRAALLHLGVRASNIVIDGEGARLGGISPEGAHAPSSLFDVAVLAPEQVAGGPCDVRTDLYAIGALLYLLVTGHAPVETGDAERDRDPEALRAAIGAGDVPDPRHHRADIGESLASVLVRATRRHPADRYQSATHLGEDLDRLAFDFAPVHTAIIDRPQDDPAGIASSAHLLAVRASALGAPAAAAGAPSRRRMPIAASIAAGLLLAGAGVAAWMLVAPAPAAPEPVASAVADTVSGPAVAAPAQRAAAAPPAAGSAAPERAAPAPMDPVAAPSSPPSPPSPTVQPDPPAAAAPPAVPAPAWAAAGGRDAAGIWAQVQVGQATLRLRELPPGTFAMGSPTDEPMRDEGERLHQVVLARGFWIAETEVPQRLYVEVMGANPSRHRGDDLPVDGISWEDAQAFAARLAARVPGFHPRLPTEAEWEYACRAGSAAAFAGGADPDRLGWTQATCGDGPRPVARLEPNAWGLYDMHGNVMEWCQDFHAAYPEGSVRDPLGWAGVHRVVRGGAWSAPPAAARAAARMRYLPTYRMSFIGLRLAHDR